jgi:hypothetical protein
MCFSFICFVVVSDDSVICGMAVSHVKLATEEQT